MQKINVSVLVQQSWHQFCTYLEGNVLSLFIDLPHRCQHVAATVGSPDWGKWQHVKKDQGGQVPSVSAR